MPQDARGCWASFLTMARRFDDTKKRGGHILLAAIIFVAVAEMIQAKVAYCATRRWLSAYRRGC